ncbi:ribonuclease P protein subunit p21 isoform 5-T6 [Vipera latastei]
MDSTKRQNDMTLEDEPLRSEGIQYATGEEQRASTSSTRKNEATGPKPKGRSAVDVSGGERKVRCCKDFFSIGTWNVRSMNQGKLDVVNQEMTRLNIDILGISKLKWTGMGEFNSDDHQLSGSFHGQESILLSTKKGCASLAKKKKAGHQVTQGSFCEKDHLQILLLSSCSWNQLNCSPTKAPSSAVDCCAVPELWLEQAFPQ